MLVILSPVTEGFVRQDTHRDIHVSSDSPQQQQQQEQRHQNQSYDEHTKKLNNNGNNGQGQDWWKENDSNPSRGKNNNHAAVSGERKMSETNADIDGDDTNSKSGILKVEKTLNHDGSIKKVRVFFTMEVVRKRRKKC